MFWCLSFLLPSVPLESLRCMPRKYWMPTSRSNSVTARRRVTEYEHSRTVRYTRTHLFRYECILVVKSVAWLLRLTSSLPSFECHIPACCVSVCTRPAQGFSDARQQTYGLCVPVGEDSYIAETMCPPTSVQAHANPRLVVYLSDYSAKLSKG